MVAERDLAIYVPHEYGEVDDWDDEKEELDLRDVWDPDPEGVDIGDGFEGMFYEGDEDSFVYREDFFNRNGTLNRRWSALYIQPMHDGRDIMRIEQDGSWMMAGAPYPNMDDYTVKVERGRVEPKDLSSTLLYPDGSTGSGVIYFDNGIGSLSTIGAITAIPVEPEKINPKIYSLTREVDVVKRFEQHLLYAAMDPVV